MCCRVLDDALSRKLAPHNGRQDSTQPAVCTTRLGPSSCVRRLTSDELAAREQEAARAATTLCKGDGASSLTPTGGEEGERGLVCRDELAPALLAALAALTTSPTRIEDLMDGDYFDRFSKVCFADVCCRQGLLLPCDANGRRPVE